MTAVKARVFVSHCGFEGVVHDVLEALVELLPKADFDVLLDRFTLAPSEQLKKTIDGWIWTCDAAIVVVDKKALVIGEHTWVFNEASRLHDRRKTVEVIPLFVDGVRPEAIKNELWEPAGLDNPLGICGGESSSRELAARVVKVLQEKTLKRVRASGVSRRLAEILSTFSSSVLSDAATPLKDPLRDWSMQRLEHEIAESLLAKDDYSVVMDVLVKLAETNLESAGEALYVVLPFTWVNPKAAAAMSAAVRDRLPVGLNTVLLPTSQAYVARCAEEWPPWPVHAIDPASDPEYVHLEKDLDRQLKRLSGRRRNPVELLGVVCKTKVDPKLVRVVQKHTAPHQSVGLLFLVGDLDPATLPQPLRNQIVYVQPTIEREFEKEALMRLHIGRMELWDRHNQDRVNRGSLAVEFPWK
jgi:hypothetical protein